MKRLIIGRSTGAPQPWVGLQHIDDRHEIVEADDPFELKTGAFVTRPDHIGFKPPDFGQADDHEITALKALGIVDHEAVRRDIGHMQVDIAQAALFDYYRKFVMVMR